MESPPLITARKLVDIVEDLADCKTELESGKGRRGHEKLEAITTNLAHIARELFTQTMKQVVEQEEPFTSSHFNPSSKIIEAAINVCEMENIGNNRAAPICQYGVGCTFGLRGICAFFHPEAGKNKELLVDNTDDCNFGEFCVRRPLCIFKHPKGTNCHLTARGYYN